MTDYKQTGIKLGIIGGATLATLLGVGEIEKIVNDPTTKNIVDIIESISTTVVPITLAEKFMRGKNDSPVARYGVQMASLVMGGQEILRDFAFLLPIGQGNQIDYLTKLNEYKTHLTIGLASLPFLKGIKKYLEKD